MTDRSTEPQVLAAPDDDPAAPRAGLSRQVAVASLGNLMAPLSAFATAPILAHALGIEGRGELAAVTAPFLLAIVAATAGLPEAVTFFVARRPHVAAHTIRKAGVLLIGAGLLGALGTLLLAPVLADGQTEIAHLIRLSAVGVVPALCVAGLRAVAAGFEDWRLVTWERTLTGAARLFPIAGLAIIGELTTEAAFWIIILSPIAGGLAYLRLLGSARAAPAGGPSSRELLGYGGRAWIGGVSGILLSRLDQLLMIPLAGAVQLGFYAVAVNISEMTLVLNAAVVSVVLSADARNSDDLRLGRAARIGTLLATIVALGIALPMPLWVPVLFGDDFSPSMTPAALLLVAIVVGTPGSVAGAALSARGNPGYRSTSLVIALTVNAIVIVLLVPSMGANGAALATVIGSTIAGWLNVFWLRRLHGIPVQVFMGVRRDDLTVIASKVSAIAGRLPKGRA